MIENPNGVFLNQARTSDIAIRICQSVFGMDISDLAEDFVDREKNGDQLRAALGLWPQSEPSGEVPRLSDLFVELADVTALEYAIHYMAPSHALQLLAAGEDATLGAPLAAACCQTKAELFGPLLHAGADVNAYVGGRTALHWACWFTNVEDLEYLEHIAGDKVDWPALTDDGLNALQLAKKRRLWYPYQPQSFLERLFGILHAHGLRDDDNEEPLRMPGGLY